MQVDLFAFRFKTNYKSEQIHENQSADFVMRDPFNRM